MWKRYWRGVYCSIGEGVTSYSAGIIGQLKGTSAETRMIQYTIDLYTELSQQYNIGTLGAWNYLWSFSASTSFSVGLLVKSLKE